MVKISNYTVEKCVKPVLEMSIERIGVESKQVPPSKLRKSKSETWLQLPFLYKYAKRLKTCCRIWPPLVGFYYWGFPATMSVRWT